MKTMQTPLSAKTMAARPAADDEFLRIFMFAPQERIDAIKRGVPAKAVVKLAKKMNVSKDSLIGALDIPRTTFNRRERENKPLSKAESERVLGVQALIGQVEDMIRESGNPEGFDAAQWVASWLAEPVPALGGARPATYMDTIEGQKLISDLLATAQSGAYA
jgi:putative toxin-antitoxin system antitoxin component (TIGR02293 family)